MSWYGEIRQWIAEKEIRLLLRLEAPAAIYRIYGEYVVEPLIHAFKVEKMENYYAIQPLVRMGPAILPALLAHMNDDDLTRRGVFQTLGDLMTRDPKKDWSGLLPVFAHCLEDGKYQFAQRSAIRCVGLLGTPGLAVLTKALGRTETAGYARDELIGIGLPAVPFLMDLLKDEKARGRGHAAEAINRIAVKHPRHDWSEAIPLLVKSIYGNHYFVKKAAARALGHVGDASAICPLVMLLGGEKHLAGDAIRAIGNLAERHPEYDWGEAGEALSAYFRYWVTVEETKELVLDTFKKIGRPIAPALIDALRCEDNNVSWSATAVLEDIAGKNGGVDLKEVKEALDDYFHTVRKKGNPVDMALAKRKAVQQYLAISRALTKFRRSASGGMEGVLLEGTFEPRSKNSIYRAQQRRAFV